MSYLLRTEFEYSLFPKNIASRSFLSIQSRILIKQELVIPPLTPSISFLVEKSSHNKQSEKNLCSYQAPRKIKGERGIQHPFLFLCFLA